MATKVITIKDLRDKTDKELQTTVQDLRVGLAKIRFQVTINKQKDFSQVTKTRKQIARIETILNERTRSA